MSAALSNGISGILVNILSKNQSPSLIRMYVLGFLFYFLFIYLLFFLLIISVKDMYDVWWVWLKETVELPRDGNFSGMKLPRDAYK